MNSFLNAEVARVRYAELLREASNERLARSLDDTTVTRTARTRRLRRLLPSLLRRPSFA